MGDNDAMSKAIELEQAERVECRGTYGNNSCGWKGERRSLTAVGCCPACGGGHIISERDGMIVDMRTHRPIRDQVHAGLRALLVQGRQIWGDTIHPLSDIVPRLMVGVGDLARLQRDRPMAMERRPVNMGPDPQKLVELKKELGNIIFSTIRWIDDLGLDVLECLDLAIEAQEKFAKSGRPR